jgi:ribosomal protein S27AE
MTHQDRLGKRDTAPPQRGLHVAGTDGEFSRHVKSDRPRCPECRVLYADGVDRGLCDACQEAYREAEEESQRWADRQDDREGDA